MKWVVLSNNLLPLNWIRFVVQRLGEKDLPLFSRMVLWVFGYGSLVWNPGFKADEEFVGYIKGYRRVFDLACTDHRGTPESPARTCTLEAQEGAISWGRAYCVRGGPEKERLAMEEEGEFATPFLIGVQVFISTPNESINKYYLGPAPLQEMARQIAKAAGPCGNNRDYVFKLEQAMNSIGHADQAVIMLANEVRKILGGIHNVFHLSPL